jgi:outer membrane lipoprotein-sorting protein
MGRKTTMKKVLAAAALCAVIALCGLAVGQEAPRPSSDSADFPIYVMNKIDDQYRGEKSQGVMAMRVKTKHWTRTMELESWSLGKDYSLVRIIKPKKEKGTATLKAKNVLYTYLSKTGRTIKISSGMMGGSWMGSHFTNDDLVKSSRMADDYDIKMSFEGEKGGTEVCSFTLTARYDAPVVWGKIEVTVRSNDLQPVSQTFYDEDGKAVRELSFSDYKDVGGRIIPTKMMMKPLDGSGEYTEVITKNIDFQVKLPKSFFSLQKLKSL